MALRTFCLDAKAALQQRLQTSAASAAAALSNDGPSSSTNAEENKETEGSSSAPLTIVMGNEAADADSIISSITLSFLRQQQVSSNEWLREVLCVNRSFLEPLEAIRAIPSYPSSRSPVKAGSGLFIGKCQSNNARCAMLG